VGQMFSLQSFLPLKIGLFLIGMIMAWTWMENKGRLTPKGTILLLLVSFIAACARDKNDGGLTGTIILVVSLLLILLLFRDPSLISLGIQRWASIVENFLSNRLSRFLADVSYAVYLVHILLMIPLLRFLCSFPWFVHQRSGFRFLILTSVAGPATYGVAWMLFRIVETRGIQLGKMWVEKLATDRTLETSDRSLTTTRGGAQ
jgi:peptidoglycan/LPS O-acetylase OafA/YrhL